ncbi:ZEB2-regulated ABC transporter 1 [Colletotrichum fructicola]|uniref:Multidrug resistance protein cdr1 n=1 Tax=Colletotrichum fructicola (strain Nara gc5) TaxID=1213859 RepID=L2G365_COLFN|nr:ZEB2-regulated ABC transporter 1 [Colletotrichum fructicola]KAF4482936.1 ZEB2-regulated ABC transporter 1 [Colletotrichum fructicola Nara gc5]KAE9568421.1 ZEB2-regulated ABC transporter 1 [Colletotrichum fructicola]KAF4430785.1 ZEB2-regulated ABC transporter 1 [Colletotrichum fructicola]KAF4884395.1 ZEB2-regulated ABC transporter 1 [Colletotrichum fructicola]KAF4908890.1 ZEB2-regulated ABC transporter 1 [Colletotrichum fructicola]
MDQHLVSPHEDVRPASSNDTLREKTIQEQHHQSDETDLEISDDGVNELVRGYSLELVRTSTRPNSSFVNPFLSKDPSLDPSSREHFNAKKWTRSLLQHSDHDPEKFPRLEAGVAWRNLSVHGFGTDTDYQKDVLNVLLQGPMMIKQFFSNRRQKIDILREFDGIVKSGEMLLVLGRPGSGVSTLLKTIAGETNGLHLESHSHLSYQGIPMETMHKAFRGEVIYQAETDIHFPHMTVGQTLLFAALARTPKNRLPGVSRQRYAEHLRDVVMAVFGISHTINTKVGNDFVRGVSGGERKRVSIAEVTLSQSPIQCWDNSTRGLDSATALEFAKTLRLSTNVAKTSAVVAMYQASQPAYDVFDKVSVLYQGRQIYFGPTELAKHYFVEMGYACPDRQTTADFLTSLTNPAERVVRPGFENRVPRSPDEFATVWKGSQLRARLMEEIHSFEEQYPMDGSGVNKFSEVRKAHKQSLTSSRSPYTISVPMQVWLCMTRGYQRLSGDKLFFFVTVLGNMVISLVLGSIFFDLPADASSMNSRCILIFFAILFNGLSSALEILTLYVQRPVVEKHARYALYHPFSEAISSTICDLPSKILSTLAFNIPLYFMAKLRQEADAFFIFLLFGFTTTLSMSMILRTIGQTSRTIHQALTPAAIFILALVIYTGFILPTSSMKGWLRWINYINPIAYAFESLVANEFTGRQFPCADYVPAYPNATPSQRACAVAGAMPGADFVDGDFYMNAHFSYYKSHMWRNFGILIGYIIFFFTVYLVAAEFITTNRSKGEVLLFRKGHKSTTPSKAVSDEENGRSDRVYRNEKEVVSSPRHPAARQPTRQQHQAVFHWKDVCYDITINGEDRRILSHVAGWVKPGTLTALMGSTGAGKTTLLDVLANRATMGVVSGDMLVNGIPRDQSFQRKTGYVQQQDIHLETSTVREALQFSAMLRQPASISKQEKYAYVEEVIELLEMEAYADAIVGVPGEGLNVEQRKRLTIGVELAAKPDLLLFLDEPTSGLDSQTAWSIASLIRKLSENGQAILCTIHQPSALLFQQFDRLLLLAHGGKTVYFGDIGENSRTLTGYFEQYGATPCGPDENPAEWMLKVIGAAPGAKAERDWHQTWKDSDESVQVQRELARLEKESPASGSLGTSEKMSTYATPFSTQLAMCTRRVFQQYWRTPSYIYSKLILSGVTSLFIGVSFYKAELTMQGLQSQMFSIFMLLVVFAFLVYQTMPNFILQREQYEARERASRAYSWYVFMLVNIIVELPWNTLAAIVIFFPFYYLVGMYRNAIPTDAVTERGGLMFLLVWAFMLFESTFADMVVAGVPTAEIGATLSLLLFAMCLIFCGVIVPMGSLPTFWKFMYRVSPLTYLVDGLLSTGLAHNAVQCSPLELLQFSPPANVTCGAYMETYMQVAGGRVYNPESTDTCQFCSLANTDMFLAMTSASYDERWRNYGLMFVYIVFNLFAALGLYWLARVPKKFSLSQLWKKKTA